MAKSKKAGALQSKNTIVIHTSPKNHYLRRKYEKTTIIRHKNGH